MERSSSIYFTPKDIIASAKKHGIENILTLLPDNIRNFEKVSYVPYTCKTPSGKQQMLKLKFINQIIAASAKLPYKTPAEEAKFLVLMFRRLTLEDLEKSDYPDNKKKELLDNNAEFIDCLDIIADAQKNLMKRMSTLKLKKVKCKGKTLSSFRQTHRDPKESDKDDEEKNKDTEENTNEEEEEVKVKLENPLYRCKLPVDPVTKKIGKTIDGKFTYIIMDARKSSNVDGKNKVVPAKILIKKNLEDLTSSNTQHFVTYLSLVSGELVFDSISISQNFISPSNKINILHVWPHKSIKEEAISEEERNSMSVFGSKGYVDEIVVEEPKENISKTASTNYKIQTKINENYNSDEEQDLDEEEPEENYEDQTSSRTIVTLKSDNKVENENNESNTRNEEPLQEETTNEFGRTSEEILEQPKPKLKIKKSSSSKSKN